jgi:Fe-S cluster assembly iron-binding protein IscA
LQNQQKEVHPMLNVTPKATALLKAAKKAEGASPDAGIRIVRGNTDPGDRSLAVGFAITDEAEPGDEMIEQNGLRIFVEDALTGPLDGRTLDVSAADQTPQLIFR